MSANWIAFNNRRQLSGYIIRPFIIRPTFADWPDSPIGLVHRFDRVLSVHAPISTHAPIDFTGRINISEPSNRLPIAHTILNSTRCIFKTNSPVADRLNGLIAARDATPSGLEIIRCFSQG
jgi:hypothetical protein